MSESSSSLVFPEREKKSHMVLYSQHHITHCLMKARFDGVFFFYLCHFGILKSDMLLKGDLTVKLMSP